MEWLDIIVVVVMFLIVAVIIKYDNSDKAKETERQKEIKKINIESEKNNDENKF